MFHDITPVDLLTCITLQSYHSMKTGHTARAPSLTSSHATDIDTRESRDTRRVAIAEDIDIHMKAISQLKSSSNTLSPISRLPTEILAEIFVQYAATCRGNLDFTNFIYPSPSEWIAVAHVCRHWRATARGCTKLWTHISHRASNDWIAESFALSKQAPLFIDSSKNEVIVGRLSSEMPRIQELLIQVKEPPRQGPYPYARSLDAMLLELQVAETPARNLRKLVLRGGYSFKYNYISYNGPSLQHTLLDGAAPLLEHLEMSRLSFTWCPSFQQPNLRHLEVSYQIYDCPTQKGDSASLLAALDMMPLLETLHLQYSIPDKIPVSIPGTRAITMPHLSSITLVADSLDCANLLTHLRIPSDPDISLQGSLPDTLDFMDSTLR